MTIVGAVALTTAACGSGATSARPAAVTPTTATAAAVARPASEATPPVDGMARLGTLLPSAGAGGHAGPGRSRAGSAPGIGPARVTTAARTTAAEAHGEQGDRGRTDLVAGGITSAPTGIPTALDPASFDFSGFCPEQWFGSWTGNSVCEVKQGHFDPTTGVLTATLVDTFTGVWMVDHSQGTLTIDEAFEGNVITGGGVLVSDIVDGAGDPSFQCSSGHLVMPFYFNVAGSYGGYRGTWHHGCDGPEVKAKANKTGYGVPHDEVLVEGGLNSVPVFIPTSFDPSTFTITGLCDEGWNGELSGASTCEGPYVHVDPSTGDWNAHIIDSFVGVDTVDKSHGSLVIDEQVSGNLFTGSSVLDGEIVSGDGDPTFKCARGHITMGLYANAPGAFGGYVASWHHDCRAAH